MARILVASDVARTRISIAGALTRAGHTVDRVSHLRLATTHADVRGVDVVLVDLGHPFQQEQFVAGLRARSDLPIVVIVDTFRVWAVRRLQACGASILTHPLSVDDIVEQLEQLLTSR